MVIERELLCEYKNKYAELATLLPNNMSLLPIYVYSVDNRPIQV